MRIMKYMFCRQQPKGDWIKYQTDDMETYSLMQYDDFIKFLQNTVENRIDFNRFMFELNSFQLIIVLKSGDWKVDYDEAKAKTEPSFLEMAKLNESKLEEKEEEPTFLDVALKLFQGKKKNAPINLQWFDRYGTKGKLQTDLSNFRRI